MLSKKLLCNEWREDNLIFLYCIILQWSQSLMFSYSIIFKWEEISRLAYRYLSRSSDEDDGISLWKIWEYRLSLIMKIVLHANCKFSKTNNCSPHYLSRSSSSKLSNKLESKYKNKWSKFTVDLKKKHSHSMQKYIYKKNCL